MDGAPSDLARTLILALKARGISFVFGVSRKGSNADLIKTIEEEGLRFIAGRSVLAATVMASVQAEMAGDIGVLLIEEDPAGRFGIVDGLTYARLENVPLLAIASSSTMRIARGREAFDQRARLVPLAKKNLTMSKLGDTATIDHLLHVALRHPAGPVHLGLGAKGSSSPFAPRALVWREDRVAPKTENLEKARQCLEKSEKPVLVIGMEARTPGAARAVNELVDQLRCPVLTTARAKGVLSDRHPCMVGQFHHGTAEADVLKAADLVISYGLDPREVIDRPWSYHAPVLEVTAIADHAHPFTATLRVVGVLAPIIDALNANLGGKRWNAGEITAFRARMHSRYATGQQHRRSAKSVIETVKRLAPATTRLVVDRGPHNPSALAFWPAERSFGILEPNSSDVLGYALPAAIAASLLEPDHPVLAVTSIDGLMASLGELATAADLKCNITILIMNDQPAAEIDFATIARGFGVSAWRAGRDDALGGALSEALSSPSPSLVDIMIDPSGYADQRTAVLG